MSACPRPYPLLTAACLVLLSSTAAVAATLAPDQILRERQQQLDQQRQELLRHPDVVLPPPAPVTPRPATTADTLCFPITQIELLDAIPAWQTRLAALARQDQGQCLGTSRIQALVARLTDDLVAHGFVTSRVYLPEQNLKSGVLHLYVVAGRVAHLRLKNGGEDPVLAAAFPLTPGAVLNVRDLEQGLEQLSRAHSQHATMEIVPSANAGESDIVVDLIRDKAWSASLSWDDSGQDSTGKQQGSVTLDRDNVIGISDVLSLSWSQDSTLLSTPRSRSNSVSWLLPYGNWTGMLSYSESAYVQPVAGVNQTYSAPGHSSNTLLSLSRLLQRDQVGKTELALQLTRKASRSYLEDTEIVQQRSDLTLLGMEISHRRFVGTWTLNGALGYIRGIGGWGAMANTQEAQGGPTAREKVYTARLDLSTPFAIGTQKGQWSSQFKAQYTRDLLPGSEQFSIGSRYTVRGFDGSSLVGQSGYYLRNEATWLAPPNAHGDSLQLFVGLDAGQVSDANVPSDARTLSGWACGLRVALTSGLGLELVHEQAMHQPASWPRPSITHFRASMTF